MFSDLLFGNHWVNWIWCPYISIDLGSLQILSNRLLMPFPFSPSGTLIIQISACLMFHKFCRHASLFFILISFFVSDLLISNNLSSSWEIFTYDRVCCWNSSLYVYSFTEFFSWRIWVFLLFCSISCSHCELFPQLCWCLYMFSCISPSFHMIIILNSFSGNSLRFFLL